MRVRSLRVRHWYALGLVVVTLGTGLTSIAFWYLAQRAALTDTLNGNIIRLTDAVDTVRRIKRDPIWRTLPDWMKEAILSVEDSLGNVAAKSMGFRELSHIRAALVSEDEGLSYGDLPRQDIGD